ncbi:hypothetical protein Mapa_016500 [Marchantia paleacea]|nr:hypothetical protein Mapa_016500 [Marchantia paleacea]
MHTDEDIRTSNKLSIDEDLGNGRPPTTRQKIFLVKGIATVGYEVKEAKVQHSQR